MNPQWGHVAPKGVKFVLVGGEQCDILDRGCQAHFHWGHISLVVAFKGRNVIATP